MGRYPVSDTLKFHVFLICIYNDCVIFIYSLVKCDINEHSFIK